MCASVSFTPQISREDVEVTRLVAALGQSWQDATESVGTERAAVGGIGWSFSLQGEELVTGCLWCSF